MSQTEATTVIETPVTAPARIVDTEPKQKKTKTFKVNPNKIIKDERVDEIALIQSLNPVLEALKSEMKNLALAHEAKTVEGLFATGTISVNNDQSEVNATKFLKLYEDGKLTKKDFIACITVGKEKAKKVLGEAAIKKISTAKPPKAPSFTVKQQDEKAPKQLTDVLQRLEPVVNRFKLAKADAAAKTEK